MAWVATAVVGGSLLGGYMGGEAQTDAANTAAGAQMQSAQLGIAEQRRQFDAVQALLKPYTDAGEGSLIGYNDLLGMNGADKQRLAINGIAMGPEYEAMMQQGEEGILANASATGGLRGGNTQMALAQFRPQVLSQLIDQRFQRLGGLTSMGQNAAAMTGNAGMQTGQAVSSLLQQQGAAQAGAAMAGGQATANQWNMLGQAGGMFMTGKALKVF